MTKEQATQEYWYIRQTWNKSRTQVVTLTVEQALKRLRRIRETFPSSVLARQAESLTEEIVSRTVDTYHEECSQETKVTTLK